MENFFQMFCYYVNTNDVILCHCESRIDIDEHECFTKYVPKAVHTINNNLCTRGTLSASRVRVACPLDTSMWPAACTRYTTRTQRLAILFPFRAIEKVENENNIAAALNRSFLYSVYVCIKLSESTIYMRTTGTFNL
jgi:hypothetical protein